MVELWNNPRFVGDAGITVGRNYRIAFNVSFVKLYGLKDVKFCYITIPEINKKGIKIGFVFTKDTETFPEVKPLKLTTHPKSRRFQTQAKTWFDEHGIDPKSIEGTWPVVEGTDPKIGKIYWITPTRK